ncbi:hypothetical protein CORC01_09431 [Colletotrichum orchidophilum]|uniref:Uncharacterized protein n=1 Tax=Colletotrichum orchidophilum TaxID=1209926 RepID=A0A1G4B1Q0_9PEZI|nr:uncharacterized protein CORC01_09431 [Colletotrichum orchidophilum]OHE95286.1 hypothetical protein CORC01_09431 [Colletotrichum orchidophilum]
MVGSRLAHCVANRTDSRDCDHTLPYPPSGWVPRRNSSPAVRPVCPSPKLAISPRPTGQTSDLTRSTRPGATRAFPFPVSSWSWTPAT